ncbi:unnamed protein product [Mortierella alpina]
MADRKATNKYYPPDWDPSKGQSKEAGPGHSIVRFELPYNIWCNGCNKPIGMGVRYNAEKKKIGNYYSTAILSFRMKCHLCDNWFEIQTDPKVHAAYVVTAGARKKVEDFDAKDNETLEIDTPEEFERRANDKFARLEHERINASKAQTEITALTRLQRLNERQWSDPYALSQKLRKEFRTEKKARQKENSECKLIADRVGFAFNILSESEEDRSGSKRIEFESGQKAIMEQRLKAIKSGGLFTAQKYRKGASGGFLAKSQTGEQPSISANRVLDSLATTVSSNTRLQVDPFLNATTAGRTKVSGISSKSSRTQSSKTAVKLPLVSYGADEDEEDDADNDNGSNQ